MTIAASLFAALTLTSGLHGVVTRAPVTPVCRVGQACSAPAARTKVSFVRSGRTFSTRTDDAGRYRILLAPGTYRIVIATTIGSYVPHSAVVVRGIVSRRNIAIDTGIR